MENKTCRESAACNSKRLICTPSQAAKNAFFYVQEAGVFNKNDTADTQRHDLDSFLFVAVTAGKGELTINGEEFELTKGNCFLIDCRTPHHYKSVTDDPWEIVWIHFNGATSRQYYENFISQSRNVFRPPSFEDAVDAISKIIGYNEQNNANAEALSSAQIVRLLTIALTTVESEHETDSALTQKMAAVHEYIEHHFSEDITLERLAAEFYISKFYLTREYKKIYGKTIFQHIINCRINYGKRLLRFSDRSVDEIAHLCGFNDQSYFVRQFKKAENVTCFAYRKMWREK